MKVTVLQENLNRALSGVTRIVGAKAQLPILSNVLIKAEKGILKLTTTNLEIGMVIPVGAKVEEEGEITVPAKVFAELVGELPVGEVTLTTNEEQKMTVLANTFRADLAGVAASEFPALPTFEKKQLMEWPAEDFLGGLKRVIFAAATDDGRPTLTGVNFNLDGAKPRMAATDGFRLSVVDLPSPGGEVVGEGGEEKVAKIIVPARALSELLRLAGEGESSETVGISSGKERQLRFSVGKAEIITRLIEGDFPDYEKIMPKEVVASFTGDREVFQRAVRLSSIYARESANVIKFLIDKKQLKLYSSSSQLGTNEGTIEGKVEGEDGFTVSFNFRYILDYLGSCEGEEITCEFSGPLSPGVFRDGGVKGYTHVVMPVRT